MASMTPIPGVNYFRFAAVYLGTNLVINFLGQLIPILAGNPGLSLVASALVAGMIEGRMHAKASGMAPEGSTSWAFALRAAAMAFGSYLVVIAILMLAMPQAREILSGGINSFVIGMAIIYLATSFLLIRVFFPLGAKNFLSTAGK